MNSIATGHFDLHANSLLASTFSHPSEVLETPLLSSAEKRCVLAAWASDAFAVEDKPWLRQLPGSDHPIPLLDIFRAIRRLDQNDDPPPLSGAPGMRPIVFENEPLAAAC
ncbi:MAG TPA: hypothetical protein VHC94_20035 [Nitrobacter sp.]|nr:hypothetical protein [Nitrobacter sp.]